MTCPGRRLSVSGSLLGICIACAKLRTAPSHDLKPAAHQTAPRGIWVCVNWSAE